MCVCVFCDTFVHECKVCVRACACFVSEHFLSHHCVDVSCAVCVETFFQIMVWTKGVCVCVCVCVGAPFIPWCGCKLALCVCVCVCLLEYRRSIHGVDVCVVCLLSTCSVNGRCVCVCVVLEHLLSRH